MFSEDFEFLINLVGPKIQKNDTHFRRAITVKERLSVTFFVFVQQEIRS